MVLTGFQVLYWASELRHPFGLRAKGAELRFRDFGNAHCMHPAGALTTLIGVMVVGPGSEFKTEGPVIFHEASQRLGLQKHELGLTGTSP